MPSLNLKSNFDGTDAHAEACQQYEKRSERAGDFLKTLQFTKLHPRQWTEQRSLLPGIASENLSFHKDVVAEIGNVIRFSAPKPILEHPSLSIVALQEWEGTVEEISEEGFSAMLHDVSIAGSRPTERATIPLELLDDADRSVLSVGVIFRLIIGRERRSDGRIQNKTLIYLRRSKFKVRQEDDKSRINFRGIIKKWI